MIQKTTFSSRYTVIKEENVPIIKINILWGGTKYEKQKVERPVFENKKYLDQLVLEFLNKIGKNNIIQILDDDYLDRTYGEWVYHTTIYYDDANVKEKS